MQVRSRSSLRAGSGRRPSDPVSGSSAVRVVLLLGLTGIAPGVTADCFDGVAAQERLLPCPARRADADTSAPDQLRPGLSVTLESGAKLRRITSNELLGVSDGEARHAYSRRQAWNADETLVAVGQKLLDPMSLEVFLDDVPLSSERLWSHRFPRLMFGMQFDGSRLNRLARLDVDTRETVVLAQFDRYERCTIGEGEGVQTNDDQKVLLTCKVDEDDETTALVAVDLSDGQVIAKRQIKEDVNWAGYSQSGKYVLVESRPIDSSAPKHLIRMTSDLLEPTVITDDRHHGDFGLDANGEDVFVMIDDENVEYLRLRDGLQITLDVSDRIGPLQHGHVSCRNTRRPGWCYFSAGSDRVGAVRIGEPSSNGTAHARGDDDAELELWGRHYSSASEYASQPKAVASPSGRQVMFTSDWQGEAEVNDYVLSVD